MRPSFSIHYFSGDEKMHTMERALTQMLEYMRESAPLLKSRIRKGEVRREYFLLYYERLLELVDGALRLIGQTKDWAPTNVLLRSALECSVDLCNLAQREGYEHIITAMMMDSKSALFHFKSEPTYSELVELYGRDEVVKMGLRAKEDYDRALKTATEHFPFIRNSSRNLNVLNRFRIAGQEERYQTEYSLLSMVTHNDMTVMSLKDELDDALDERAVDVLSDERAWNMCLRFLVDALAYKTQLFGRDDALIQACMGCLEPVCDKQKRKEKNGC